MKTKQELIQFLFAHNIDGLSAQRVQHILPALRLVDQVSYYQLQAGQSKLGGFPDLPPHQTTPIDEKGEPYLFIAQLNLAEIAPLAAQLALPLPEDGLLSFFVEEHLEETQVFFYKNIEELELATFTHYSEVPYLCQRVSFQPWYTHPQHDYHYLNIPSKPKWSNILKGKSPYAPELLDDGGEQIEEGVWQAYYEYHEQEELYKHQVGGHYQCIQDNLLEPNENLEEWYLLLQVDSDDRLGFNWIDGGMLYFFIRKEDLAQQDFSQVVLKVDFY